MTVMAEEKVGELSKLTRDRRAALGISLAKVATASGDPDMHPSWVSRLENGQVREIPSRARLESLARGLQLPAQQVARAAGAQFLGLAEERSEDETARAIVDHLELLTQGEREQLRAMVEAFARNRHPG